MEESKINLDYQRMIASVSMNDDDVKVVIVSNNDARYIELPDYGELNVKMHDGKITIFEVTEKHQF